MDVSQPVADDQLLGNEPVSGREARTSRRIWVAPATLEQLGLLTHITRLKKAPLSPTGLTRVNRYLLQEPFGQLAIDDIGNDDVIEAIVNPAPPKSRPGKVTAGASATRAGS